MSAVNPGDKAGWFWICVDSLKDGIIYGTIQSQFQPEPVAFCGLDHVIQIGEDIMNDVNFPQGFFCLRRFGKLGKKRQSEMRSHHDRCLLRDRTRQPIVTRYGKWATFNVHVLFKRNASWQGKVTLFYNKKSYILHFRSVLELTLAMREVLMDIKNAEAFIGYDEENDCCAAVQSVSPIHDKGTPCRVPHGM